jgi:hypothetical protein
LALLLGLGLPRSFLLLDAVLVAVAWWGWRRPGPAPSAVVLWSTAWLLVFGVSYAAFQVGWRVWWPPLAHGPQLLAMLMPAAALAAGWLLPRFGRERLSCWLVAYGSGALLYALLSVALSRTPWWNLAQTFVHDVRVPWGPQPWMNMRSVEQRAFLALALLPVALPLRWRPTGPLAPLALPMLVMAALAAHVAWALQGRIGLAVLVVAALPGVWLLPWPVWRRRLACVLAVTAAVVLGSGRLCDERWWLQLGFLQRLGDAPWGGRLIQFVYRDCRADLVNRFGAVADATAFSPHNVVLDVYNDAGWLPALCLLLALLPVLLLVLQGFWRVLQAEGWNAELALRWSVLAVLMVQWLLQPFFYSDQLMCTLGFLLAGALLAEFNPDTPAGWCSARPSHPGRSPGGPGGCASPAVAPPSEGQPR